MAGEEIKFENISCFVSIAQIPCQDNWFWACDSVYLCSGSVQKFLGDKGAVNCTTY